MKKLKIKYGPKIVFSLFLFLKIYLEEFISTIYTYF